MLYRKFYIVTPLLLQGQHNTGQIAVRNFLAAALMADVEVLTEQTHQVAMGEKDRSGAMPAHERILFPKMGIGARNPGRGVSLPAPPTSGALGGGGAGQDDASQHVDHASRAVSCARTGARQARSGGTSVNGGLL